MALPEAALRQPASSRYAISVIGGDSVFLVDRCIGHKVHMGADRLLARPDFRRHVASLDHDLKQLSIGEFFAKHGLRG
ncbi:MAG: hypothetical protein NTU88_06170 [Armatimonadetes bacterium]|nr:hypothetical protein [Armatimonadota bacterium]